MKKLLLILLILSFIVYPAEGAYRKQGAWIGKPPVGSDINYSHPLARGLVLCILANENGGNNIIDLTKYHSATNSGFLWKPSLRGISLFNSGDTLNKISTTDTFVDEGKSLSGLFLYYPITATGAGSRVLLHKSRASLSTDGIYFRTATTQALQFGANFIGFAFHTTNTNAYTLNAFHQFGFTWDGSGTSHNMRLFIDGLENTTGTFTDGTGNQLMTNNLTIGNRYDGNRSIDGYLVFAYLWNRVLSPSEMRSLNENPYQIFVAPKRRIISQVITETLQRARAFLID